MPGDSLVIFCGPETSVVIYKHEVKDSLPQTSVAVPLHGLHPLQGLAEVKVQQVKGVGEGHAGVLPQRVWLDDVISDVGRILQKVNH